MDQETLEGNVADIVHWIWCNWQKHFFHYATVNQKTGHTAFVVTTEDYNKWKRQMMTSFYDLSTAEKKSDLDLARQIIQNWDYNPFDGTKLNSENILWEQ